MSGDPGALPLGELRAERARLQSEEDAVSFVRRMAQGRIDLAREELTRRHDGTPALGIDARELASVFAREGGGGSTRPPRETTVSPDHPLVVELERLCERVGFGDMRTLDDAALEAAVAALAEYEARRSGERRELFARIDALTAELVRRLKSGGTSVDELIRDA
ncbi:MAG: hypothetical protein ACO26C_04730 [Ilumatobacteraceae bacterium]